MEVQQASLVVDPPVELEKGGGIEASRRSSQLKMQLALTTMPKCLPRPSSKRLKQLPRWSRIIAFLRHNYTTYRQIFTLIFVVNLIVLITLVSVSSGSLKTTAAGDAAAANLAVGVLFRQEQVINMLYQLLTRVPRSWPLWIRAQAAKVLHYGGAHSGGGVAAVAWFILYTALVTKAYIQGPSRDNAEALATAWLLFVLFMMLLISALPAIRRRFHNAFEVFHRFAGWAALGVFWAHILFTAHGNASQTNIGMGGLLVRSVSFWCVLVATLPIIVSWAQLRRRKVTAERLSDHAVRLHFEYGKISTCFGIRVSTNPLLEWHSFATIPEADHISEDGAIARAGGESRAGITQISLSSTPFTSDPSCTDPHSMISNPTEDALRLKPPGFSVLISHAGDWTHRAIHSPPTTLWTRGSPTRGVIYGARLFSRVVVITTGSGIGPCLSLLVAHTLVLPATPRVIWSAPDPEKTFGSKIVDSVRHADPDAVIWNTRVKGRPNLVSLAASLVEESGAEAVYVISNPKVCNLVVNGLLDMGIHAYSPVFDS